MRRERAGNGFRTDELVGYNHFEDLAVGTGRDAGLEDTVAEWHVDPRRPHALEGIPLHALLSGANRQHNLRARLAC